MHDLKELTNNSTISKVMRKISEVIGGKPLPFKVIPLRLYQINNGYKLPNKGNVINLSTYFIDEEGSLYSRNVNTYFTKYGTLLERLSDSSHDHNGNIVNTFRGEFGEKVTIRRSILIQKMKLGHFLDVTDYGMSEIIKENKKHKRKVG